MFIYLHKRIDKSLVYNQRMSLINKIGMYHRVLIESPIIKFNFSDWSKN